MQKLKWKTDVQLIYRIFVRQFEDVNLAVRLMIEEMGMNFPVRVNFNDTEETHWPIPSERVEELQKKGYFICYLGKKPHVVIRELEINIVCDSFEHAEKIITEVISVFGNKFAVMRIVREYLTEIQAV